MSLAANVLKRLIIKPCSNVAKLGLIHEDLGKLAACQWCVSRSANRSSLVILLLTGINTLSAQFA